MIDDYFTYSIEISYAFRTPFAQGLNNRTIILLLSEISYMKIGAVLVTPEVVDKILFKHGIRPSEVDNVLRQKQVKTYYEKIEKNRYMAIGRTLRGYITVFFDHSYGVAEVASARFSTASEKRKYKRKVG